MHQLSANDYERSCTSFSLGTVLATLSSAVNHRRVRALLDVGCGYGGIAATLGESLGVQELHGIDIDGAVVEEAAAKGVAVVKADVAAAPLPYADAAFDVVTCFGMLDYLPWFDVAIREFSRVLADGGIVAVALPNLGSWHNRLALLLGYQPRDIEFCSLRPVGVAPLHRASFPVGHIHTATTRAFREMMTVMGFEEIRTVALRPQNSRVPWPLRAIDGVLGRHPALARRFLYIGRRVEDAPSEVTVRGWWTSVAKH